jgi:hypothetical protein
MQDNQFGSREIAPLTSRARACDQRTELAKHASSFKRQMAAPPAENTR